MNRSQKMVLTLWMTLLSSYALYAHSRGVNPIESLSSLTDFMTSSPWAIPIFILLFAIRPVTLFSSALMAAAGGAFFGVFWGSIATVVGANLGGAWSYWAAHAFASDDGELQGPLSKLNKHVQALKEHGFQSVLTLHLIHLPYDLVTYAAGYLKVDFKKFMTATVVGSLPGYLSFVVAGASSGLSSGSLDLSPELIIASAAVLCATLGLAEVVRRKLPQASAVNYS